MSKTLGRNARPSEKVVRLRVSATRNYLRRDCGTGLSTWSSTHGVEEVLNACRTRCKRNSRTLTDRAGILGDETYLADPDRQPATRLFDSGMVRTRIRSMTHLALPPPLVPVLAETLFVLVTVFGVWLGAGEVDQGPSLKRNSGSRARAVASRRKWTLSVCAIKWNDCGRLESNSFQTAQSPGLFA